MCVYLAYFFEFALALEAAPYFFSRFFLFLKVSHLFHFSFFSFPPRSCYGVLVCLCSMIIMAIFWTHSLTPSFKRGIRRLFDNQISVCLLFPLLFPHFLLFSSSFSLTLHFSGFYEFKFLCLGSPFTSVFLPVLYFLL